jgi:hypothetical protein
MFSLRDPFALFQAHAIGRSRFVVIRIRKQGREQSSLGRQEPDARVNLILTCPPDRLRKSSHARKPNRTDDRTSTAKRSDQREDILHWRLAAANSLFVIERVTRSIPARDSAACSRRGHHGRSRSPGRRSHRRAVHFPREARSGSRPHAVDISARSLGGPHQPRRQTKIVRGQHG